MYNLTLSLGTTTTTKKQKTSLVLYVYAFEVNSHVTDSIMIHFLVLKKERDNIIYKTNTLCFCVTLAGGREGKKKFILERALMPVHSKLQSTVRHSEARHWWTITQKGQSVGGGSQSL